MFVAQESFRYKTNSFLSFLAMILFLSQGSIARATFSDHFSELMVNLRIVQEELTLPSYGIRESLKRLLKHLLTLIKEQDVYRNEQLGVLDQFNLI